MEYIYVGKIVNTHGIKGEIRILSDFKYKNEIFKENFKLYIGTQKQEMIIKSYRKHKMYDMVLFYDINDINEVLKEAKSKRDIIEDATEKRKIQNYKFKENLDDELSKTRKVYESLVKEEKELLNIMNTLTNVSSVDIAKDMFNDLTNEGAKTEVISSDSIKPEVNVRQIPDDNTEEYSTDTFMFNTKDFDKLEDLKDNVRKTSTFIKILIIMLVIIVLAGLGFLVYKFLLK